MHSWEDALLALRALSLGGPALGGLHLRARAGPVRETWLDLARAASPGPWRRIAAATPPERLLGGLDLSATLALGAPTRERGVLAQADGGTLALAGAERAEPAMVHALAAALDTHAVRVERDGVSALDPARFALIALDEGAEPEETLAPALSDRLALRLDLSAIPWRAAQALPDPVPKADWRAVACSDAMLEAFAAAAEAAGWRSQRAALWMSRTARVLAALEEAGEVGREHGAAALRLTLGPMETAEAPEDPADAPEPDPPEPSEKPEAPEPQGAAEQEDSDQRAPDPAALQEMLVEAASAARPMIAALTAPPGSARGGAAGKSGAVRTAGRRGRVVGVSDRPAAPDARPDPLATLRAAAPWRRLRAGGAAVRKSDFRYPRIKERTESTVIFAVDASGSSALARLAEAKGAVELLLAECYVRRDRVALVGFRGAEADLLLPPTRALVRAKRALGALPGGGATPLASGVMAALRLAESERAQGRTPLLVFLTDGKGNIALDGAQNREAARRDAHEAARLCAGRGLRAVVIDIARRPREAAQSLAEAMNAEFVALPRADAAAVSAIVKRRMAGA